MTVPNTARQTAYTAGSPTTEFSVGFSIFGASDLEVWHNGVLVPTSEYTVQGTLVSIGGVPVQLAPSFENGRSDDAKIVFTTARTGSVIVVGARAPRREIAFTEGVGVPAKDHNQAYDVLAATCRELWDRMLRAILAAPGATINQNDVLAARDEALQARDATRSLFGGVGAYAAKAARAARDALASRMRADSAVGGAFAALAQSKKHARDARAAAAEVVQSASASSGSAAHAGTALRAVRVGAAHAIAAGAARSAAASFAAMSASWARRSKASATAAAASAASITDDQIVLKAQVFS